MGINEGTKRVKGHQTETAQFDTKQQKASHFFRHKLRLKKSESWLSISIFKIFNIEY